MKKKIFITLGVLGFLIALVQFLPLAFFIFSYPKMLDDAAKNNPARQLAAITIPLSKEYNLSQVNESNGSASLDNSAQAFSYTYEGNQTRDEMYDVITQYLQKNGYRLVEKRFPQEKIIEHGIEFDIKGENKVGDEVTVELNDIKDKQPRKLAIVFNFLSHECYHCTDTNPAEKLASVMSQFVKKNDLEELQISSSNGCGTYVFCGSYKYQSDQSMDVLSSKLKSYLEQQGYLMFSDFKAHERGGCIEERKDCAFSVIDNPNDIPARMEITYNEGAPVWLLWGSKSDGNVVAVISDKTYMNKERDRVFHISSGKSVIDITFNLPQCVSDCESPTSTIAPHAGAGLFQRLFQR